MYIDVKLVNRRSCYDQAVNTTVFHTRGPWLEYHPAVAPSGKARYPHCLVFQRSLQAVSPVHERVTPNTQNKQKQKKLVHF